MLRLLSLTLLFALLALSASWLSAHPGRMTLVWLGWRVDASASFLLFAIALLAVIGALLISLFYLLVEAPARRRNYRAIHNYRRGLRELTHCLVALADGDLKQCRLALKSTQKFLGHEPVTLLLGAQVARLEGNTAQTHSLLEAMLSHGETRHVAAKGLSEFHSRLGEAAQALPHAEVAAKLQPSDREALASLVAAHTRLGQWQEAEGALRRAAWFVPRAERNRLRGLICLSRALELQRHGEPGEALPYAQLARKYMPDFPPLVALVVELTPEERRTATAQKLLKHAWKREPHPVLADTLMQALAHLEPSNLMKSVRRITASRPQHEESLLLIARAAIENGQWNEARLALKAALAVNESTRACRMMAKLEEVQYNDNDAAARWRLRAKNAEEEAHWACGSCGHTNAVWQADCPRCHAFGRMEWKQPTLQYVA